MLNRVFNVFSSIFVRKTSKTVQRDRGYEMHLGRVRSRTNFSKQFHFNKNVFLFYNLRWACTNFFRHRIESRDTKLPLMMRRRRAIPHCSIVCRDLHFTTGKMQMQMPMPILQICQSKCMQCAIAPSNSQPNLSFLSRTLANKYPAIRGHMLLSPFLADN